ncbi:hypothetical protein [Sulfolobus sp. E11-6]|uniref:hypothetical protein n=1 Tax=Sulfolobus sp. E11-6 TaxID=2663020 RepID=UPI001297C860|nr:hypothetical protein [Sulfolobus sp. E11-6]QGA68909.1 hypothetical protein GFS33_09430 [Sulfolobus sp. E11-6]
MKFVLAIALLVLLLIPSIASASVEIYTSYPKEVLIGQNFTISFGLMSNIINSTNFQYITPGTRILNVSGETAYQGFGEYWLVDKVNVSNSSQLIVSFIGKIVEPADNPGIVLYSSNFSLTSRDGQGGTYEVLTAFSGILWLYKLNGWYAALTTLPIFSSGNYSVTFKDVNGTICVYSIIVNSNTYLIKYNTRIPWNSIGYVGIRTDNGALLPEKFVVYGNTIANYTVYVNGKVYSTGVSDGIAHLTLRVFSPTTVNITFPKYHVYKVIYVSPSDNANIREEFPTLQVSLVVITAVLIGLSIWREIRKK